MLSKIQRWNDFQEDDENGYWVRITDHAARVVELERAVEVLAAECLASQTLLQWPVSTRTYQVPEKRTAWVLAQEATDANPTARAAIEKAKGEVKP